MAKKKEQVPAVNQGLQCPNCRNIAFCVDGPVAPGTKIYEVRRIYGKRPSSSKPYPFCQHCFGNVEVVGNMLSASRYYIKDLGAWLKLESTIRRGYNTLEAAGIPSVADLDERTEEAKKEAEKLGAAAVVDGEGLNADGSLPNKDEEIDI